MGQTETKCKVLNTGHPRLEHQEVKGRCSIVWCDADAVNRGSVRVPVTVPSGLTGCNIIQVSHQLVVRLVSSFMRALDNL
jgi:hypothetical protein